MASDSARFPQFSVPTISERERLCQELRGMLISPPWVMSLSLHQSRWPGGWTILGTTHPFRAGVGSVPHKPHDPYKGERLFSKGKLACHYRKVKVRDSRHPCSWPLALTHSFPGPPSFHLVPLLQALRLLTCAEKPYLPDLSMTASYTSDLHSNATLSERPSWTPLKSHSVILSDFTLFICWI